MGSVLCGGEMWQALTLLDDLSLSGSFPIFLKFVLHPNRSLVREEDEGEAWAAGWRVRVRGRGGHMLLSFSGRELLGTVSSESGS